MLYKLLLAFALLQTPTTQPVVVATPIQVSVVAQSGFLLQNKHLDTGKLITDAKAQEDARLGGTRALHIDGSWGKIENCTLLDSTDLNAISVNCSDVEFYRCIFSCRRGHWFKGDLDTPRFYRGLHSLVNSRVRFRECLFINFDYRWCDAVSSEVELLNCYIVYDSTRWTFWRDGVRANIINCFFDMRVFAKPIGVSTEEVTLATTQLLGNGRFYVAGNNIPASDIFGQIYGYAVLPNNVMRNQPWPWFPHTPRIAVSPALARTRVLNYAGANPRTAEDMEILQHALPLIQPNTTSQPSH